MELRDWVRVVESTLKNTVRHSSRYQINTLITILSSVDWVQLMILESLAITRKWNFSFFFSVELLLIILSARESLNCYAYDPQAKCLIRQSPTYRPAGFYWSGAVSSVIILFFRISHPLLLPLTSRQRENEEAKFWLLLFPGIGVTGDKLYCG